jgi:hypothetical protein
MVGNFLTSSVTISFSRTLSMDLVSWLISVIMKAVEIVMGFLQNVCQLEHVIKRNC